MEWLVEEILNGATKFQEAAEWAADYKRGEMAETPGKRMASTSDSRGCQQPED